MVLTTEDGCYTRAAEATGNLHVETQYTADGLHKVVGVLETTMDGGVEKDVPLTFSFDLLNGPDSLSFDMQKDGFCKPQ